jgi:hypothetical protein
LPGYKEINFRFREAAMHVFGVNFFTSFAARLFIALLSNKKDHTEVQPLLFQLSNEKLSCTSYIKMFLFDAATKLLSPASFQNLFRRMIIFIRCNHSFCSGFIFLSAHFFSQIPVSLLAPPLQNLLLSAYN